MIPKVKSPRALEKMRFLDQKLGAELHPTRYEYNYNQTLQKIEANDEELINRLAEPDFLTKMYGSELLKLKEKKPINKQGSITV